MRAFVALLFLMLFTAGAVAQSCSSLRSQLASAEAGRPNQAVVAAIEKKSRAFGCGRSALLGRPQACSGIDAQLRQAKSGGVNRNRVRRLRRQIATHCSGGTTAKKSRPQREARQSGPRRETKGNRRNIFSALFGGIVGSDEADVETVSVDPRRTKAPKGVERVNLDTKSVTKSSRSNSYGALATGGGRTKGSSRVGNSRTMCVRLCDGFYFPINNRSHSDNYYDELAMCVGRCPGADVSLYVHYQGEAVEQMRSTMTGEAYVNLPTAFTYRKKLSPDCGCANGTRIVRGGDTAPKMSMASAADPDTLTDSGKDESRWTPYRAIYDATGEPLSPSTTSHGAVAVRTDDNGEVENAALPPRPDRPEEPGGTAFDLTADTAREVGPQYFSQAVAEYAARRNQPAGARERGQVPTIITVTPLTGEGEEERASSKPAEVGDEAGEAPVEASVGDITPGTSAMAPKGGTGG